MARLDRYFRDHAAVAAAAGTGFIIESPTWRASQDWGTRLGRSAAELAEANRTAVAMLVTARAQLDGGPVPTVVSGCIGPRGDGYDGTHLMGADQAQDYHGAQIAALAAGGADMVHAMTITYPDEAIGILRAAAAAGEPAAISFTVETDGALPDGTTVVCDPARRRCHRRYGRVLLDQLCAPHPPPRAGRGRRVGRSAARHPRERLAPQPRRAGRRRRARRR